MVDYATPYYHCRLLTFLVSLQANLPNLRRLFVDARTDAEESSYSRNAVCNDRLMPREIRLKTFKFYNLILFMSSVAAFSLIAQRMNPGRKSLGI